MNLFDYYLSTLGESIYATCVLWVQQKHTHAGMELSSSYTFSTLQTSLVLYTIKQRPPSLPVHQPMHPLPKVVQLSRAILNTWIYYGYLYTTSSLSTLHCIMSSSVYAPAIYNRVLVMDMKSSLGLVLIGRATEQDGNSGWMCERWCITTNFQPCIALCILPVHNTWSLHLTHTDSEREAFTWKTLSFLFYPLNMCHDVTIELAVLLLTVSKTEIRVGFVQTGLEVETTTFSSQPGNLLLRTLYS